LGLAVYGNNEYSYCDRGRNVLFDETKKHRYLFDYVTKDMSALPALLERYIAKSLDVTSFNLTGYQYADSDSAEIINTLKSFHPYYEHEYRDVFIRAIGDYFNSLLYAYFRDTYDNDNELREKWYAERFNHLTAPHLLCTDEYTNIFFKMYSERVGHKYPNIEESFSMIPVEPKGFSNELNTQETIKRMLFWILDIAAPGVEKLTISQRAWLFGNIFKGARMAEEEGLDEMIEEIKAIGATDAKSTRTTPAFMNSNMDVTKHLSFAPALSLFRANHDRSLELEQIIKQEEAFITIYRYDIGNYHRNHKDAPQDLIKTLSKIVDYVKATPTEGLNEEYEINSLYQLLYLELLSMIQTDTMIRMCRHCGKYFVVPNHRVAYCDGIADNETEPCSTIGSRRAYEKKIEADPALKMHNRSYKTRYARVKRAKNKTIALNVFDAWSKEARNKLEHVRSGELDLAAFEIWLKS
jgi:hypothetical protein